MTDDNQPDSPSPPAPRRRRHGWLWAVLVLALLAAGGTVGLLGLTGKPLRLPVWAVAEAEARVNRMLGEGPGPKPAIVLGGADIVFDAGFVPRLRLDDLRLIGPRGRTIASLPEVQIRIEKAPLLRGVIRLQSLRVIGAQITLRRLADGRLDLAFGPDLADTVPGSLPELLDRIEAVFALPELGSLARIDAEALTLTLDDRRAGRVWQVGDGRLTLDNRPDELALELGFGLVGGGTAPARANLTFISAKGNSAARITATVDQVAAVDIAAQAPVLGWLGVLDAPISGRLAAETDATGVVRSGTGTLDIGQGALQPTPATQPIPFDRAGLSFAFDPAAEMISFSDLSVESASLRLQASGITRVPGLARGAPEAFIGQVKVGDLRVDPEGLFQQPVRFSQGAIDLRLRLNPFRVEIGQVALNEGEQRLVASGRVSADPEGWSLALDVALNAIAHDRLLALWPLALVPKTREWLVANVQEGLLFDVTGGLRLRPGAEPLLSLGYEFAAADVRFLRTLPPIRDGYGYATLIGQTYTIVLDKGQVTPPLGGQIDVAGSVFEVVDITRKPADAEITLRTDSTITAAMSLLDAPPFGFLAKAGRPVDLAEGRAVTTARLRLPLRPKVGVEDVRYTVEGVLSDVTTDTLVPGRRLRAETLRLAADNAGLRISGAGTLGQAAFDAIWHQPFGPETEGRSRVEGRVDLSQAALDEFNIALPSGAFSGAAPAAISMDLQRGGGGTFRLKSDLRGVELRFSPIGLAKSAGAAADLTVEGRLGQPAVIDLVRLSTGTVAVEGTVALRPDGGLDLARFTSVKSGNWLDASVDLTGQGPGAAPAIAVTGGTVDLRRLPEGGASGADGPAFQVKLDRLTVTEGIALTNLSGTFRSRGGIDGDFTAQVNGAAPVRGAVLPSPNGTAARIQSDNAGAVLAAAGIFQTARGGALDLTLWPRGGAGMYDGRASVTNIQVRDAPILAELLGAISVIGLLEQLSDSGLVFTGADAEFRTSPDGVTITRSSAVGASLGVSLSGTYATATGALNMQGVISPIYLINSIGAVLTRPGEGVFGFNYDLTGTAADPVVSVNPLSILTPGMFREMFRAAPPSSGKRSPPKRNEFR